MWGPTGHLGVATPRGPNQGAHSGSHPSRGREKLPPCLPVLPPRRRWEFQEAREQQAEGCEDLETQPCIQPLVPLLKSSGDPRAVGSISQLWGGQGHRATAPPVTQHDLLLFQGLPRRKQSTAAPQPFPAPARAPLPTQGFRLSPAPVPVPNSKPDQPARTWPQ